MLRPTGTFGEDAWLTTTALLRETRTLLRYLVAFRPGVLSPTLAVQMASTYQRLSGGRLMLNIVTGGDADEQRRFGDWAAHDERCARTDEFLTVLRAAWGSEPADFAGRLPEGLTISPNLWAGIGLVRGGAGTALVGSHTEVADRIAEYHDLGVEEFVLSGYPHPEEAYRVGEGVLPELRRRGLLAPAVRS